MCCLFGQGFMESEADQKTLTWEDDERCFEQSSQLIMKSISMSIQSQTVVFIFITKSLGIYYYRIIRFLCIRKSGLVCHYILVIEKVVITENIFFMCYLYNLRIAFVQLIKKKLLVIYIKFRFWNAERGPANIIICYSINCDQSDDIYKMILTYDNSKIAAYNKSFNITQYHRFVKNTTNCYVFSCQLIWNYAHRVHQGIWYIIYKKMS